MKREIEEEGRSLQCLCCVRGSPVDTQQPVRGDKHPGGWQRDLQERNGPIRKALMSPGKQKNMTLCFFVSFNSLCCFNNIIAWSG